MRIVPSLTAYRKSRKRSSLSHPELERPVISATCKKTPCVQPPPYRLVAMGVVHLIGLAPLKMDWVLDEQAVSG